MPDMVHDIPAGWCVKPLGEVARRIRGQFEGEPENVLMIASAEGFIPQSERYGRFMAGDSLQNYVRLRRGEFSYNRGNSKVFPQGCIYRLDDWEEAAVPNVYISFALVDGALDPDFAAQFFQAGRLNRQLARVITSTARSNGLLNVSADAFFRCVIPIPPLKEQREISAILSSVDDAIAATRKIMEQTNRVKLGLLQTIASGGLRHTRFKKTAIGQIPADWELRRLEGVCKEKITYGIVQCGPYVDDGVPYIRVSDMTGPELDVRSMLRTNPKIAAKYGRSRVESGDVVYALRGTIGEVRLVSEEVAGANLTQGTARLSPSTAISSEFLLWVMRSPRVLRQAEVRSKGSTFKEITLSDLRRLHVPVPPRREQDAIVEVLDSVEKSLRAETGIHGCLKMVKRGLAQDLLTGRVRVQPD